MTRVPEAAHGGLEQAPADGHCGVHSGADRDAEEALDPTARPEAGLGERGGGKVGDRADGQSACDGSECGAEFDAVEPGEVEAPADAAALVEEGREGDADAGVLPGGERRERVAQPADDLVLRQGRVERAAFDRAADAFRPDARRPDA